MYSPPIHTACTVQLLREGEESAIKTEKVTQQTWWSSYCPFKYYRKAMYSASDVA